MKQVLSLIVLVIVSSLFVATATSPAFVQVSAASASRTKHGTTTTMSSTNKEADGVMGSPPNSKPCAEIGNHPFASLPGDPSLHIVTNVDLGDKKLEIMKACSQAIVKATGKPESYVAVSITDNANVIFGGTDEPAALGNMYSIGAISMESNGQITSDVTDLLSIDPYNVAENRIYINFFDMPRANVGWSRRTFAG